MLSVILALLPKVGPVIASLPEFANLVSRIGSTLSSTDQQTLQAAYELAKRDSNEAHADLQALVKEKLGG